MNRSTSRKQEIINPTFFKKDFTRDVKQMHIIYYITIAQCTLSTLGKLAFTVSSTKLWTTSMQRLPLFFGTFTSPYLFGKRSQAFLPELPCALAAIQQIPVGQVNDDLDVFTSFWTGQYVETWIASANLFFVDYSACNPVSQFWKDDPCSVSCRWKIEPIQ